MVHPPVTKRRITMKKLFAILLTATLLLSVMIIPANAAIPPQKYGDVSYDEDVNIMDATAIQQALANLITLDSRDCEAADVDGDSNVSIIDATTIQMYLANLIIAFPAGEFFLIDKYLFEVTPSAMSGKAQAGDPVDFEVNGYAYPEPSTAYLYVNDELVDTATGADSTLTYTFEKADTYSVKVVLADKWGDAAGVWTTDFKVVEPVTDTSKPYISNIAITDTFHRTPTITVEAIHGSGDYTYSYYISYPYEDIAYMDIIHSERDVKDNTITIDFGVLDYCEPYFLTVIVTDSNGNTAEATTSFMCEPLAPA